MQRDDPSRLKLDSAAGHHVAPRQGLPIAVVIVCRNASEALEVTLASVAHLGDARLLTVVIDGASTDGTAAFLDTCQPPPFHARSEPDRGIYDAMNKGWQAAPADAFVLYLGAGDRLLEVPDAAALLDAEGRPWPVVIGRVDLGGQPFHSRWTGEMRWRNTAHHQALLVHKSVSPQPPFDVSLRVYADWDFNLRLLRRGVAAHELGSLRAWAEPGGVSWRHDLAEIRRVATRHGGLLVGWGAWALNRVSLWRRQWRGG